MPKRILGRAFRETNWFSLKTDIMPVIMGGIASGVVLYDDHHDKKDFVLGDLIFPAAVGVVLMVAYWVVLNGIEFLWNCTQAGNRLEIERLTEAQPEFKELLNALEQRLREAEAERDSIQHREIAAAQFERERMIKLALLDRDVRDKLQADLSVAVGALEAIANTNHYGTYGLQELAREALARLAAPAEEGK